MAKRIIRWKVFPTCEDFVFWQNTHIEDINIISVTPIFDSAATEQYETKGSVIPQYAAFVTYYED